MNLAAYEAQEYANDVRDARLDSQLEQIEDELRGQALEDLHDYKHGFGGELTHHCLEHLERYITWQLCDDTHGHPYREPGGMQMALDDKSAIKQQINGWVETRLEQLKEDWKQDAIESGEY